MNKMKLLKLHIYSYRLIYFFYIVAFVLLSYIYYKFTFLDSIISNANLVIIISLFSFATGYYEFSVMSNSYLGLKINRSNFYWSTIIFGLFNTLIQSIILIIFALIDKTKYAFILKNFSNPLIIIIFILFVYKLGCFYSLFLSKIKYFNKVLLSTIIAILIIFGSKIYESIIILFAKLNFINYTNLNLYTILMIALILIFNIVNYMKFTKKY